MTLSSLGIHILMVIFALGVAGCLITIPMCAFKFFAVLVEGTHPDEKDGNLEAGEPQNF